MGGTGQERDARGGVAMSVISGLSSDVEVALLDRDGTIVAVNQAWLDFSRTHGGDPRHSGVGRSYLAICDAAGDQVSASIAAAIRQAVRGDLPEPRQLRIPCATPQDDLWFDVLVSSRFGDDGEVAGATVTLSPVVRSQDGGHGEQCDPLEQRDPMAQRAQLAELAVQLILAILAGASPGAVCQKLVEGVAPVLGAEHVTLVVPGRTPGEYTVSAGSGQIPVMAGPVCSVQFGPGQVSAGVLILARPHGAEPFTRDEVNLLGELAREVSAGMELARARLSEERRGLLEDRHRMARDLHDNVIQDIIAAGMQLQLLAGEDDARDERIEELVDQLDEVVRRIRIAVFPLRDLPAGGPLTAMIDAVVSDAARVLASRPDVLVSGPVDELPPELGSELVAVLREGLSNVARHARAHRTQIMLVAGASGVTLVIEDDGAGLRPDSARGQGIANMKERAIRLGGRAVVEPRLSAGTRIFWQVPRPPLPGAAGGEQLEQPGQLARRHRPDPP